MSSSETIAVDSSWNNPDVPAVSTINEQVQEQALRSSVEATMENYFRHLDGQSVTDVYDMVLQEVEAPLLEIVMKNTRQNQTKAAELLGLNRGTLRKKLKRYSLL